MKTKNVIQLFVILFIGFGMLSCEDDDLEGVKTTTLTHGGFDFSNGIGGSFEGEGTAVEGADFDGEVIGWHPTGSGQGIYWRNDQDGLMNEQQSMGAITLAEVTEVPKGINSEGIEALTVGHVYVVKCKDGFAAFKVLDVNSEDWEVSVEYMFTTELTF